MFTHINKDGKAAMVDVSHKSLTMRKAYAKGSVFVGEKIFKLIVENGLKKGDVLSTAKIAGIIGAKKTGELIPLCHPLNLTFVEIKFHLDDINNSVIIFSEAVVNAPTGVEMEALTAVNIAALTIYDMCKGVDKGIVIGESYLLKKTGGKSGSYRNRLMTKGYLGSDTSFPANKSVVADIIGIIPDILESSDKLFCKDLYFDVTIDSEKINLTSNKSVMLKKGDELCLL